MAEVVYRATDHLLWHGRELQPGDVIPPPPHQPGFRDEYGRLWRQTGNDATLVHEHADTRPQLVENGQAEVVR